MITAKAQSTGHAVRDVIFYYAKDMRQRGTFRQVFAPYTEKYIAEKYPHVESSGRRYGLDNLTAPVQALAANLIRIPGRHSILEIQQGEDRKRCMLLVALFNLVRAPSDTSGI